MEMVILNTVYEYGSLQVSVDTCRYANVEILLSDYKLL